MLSHRFTLLNESSLLNRNLFDIKCDCRDNTKNQLAAFPFLIPLKTEWSSKKKRKQHEGYYRDYYCLLAC